ncbi:MAG: DoxX family protein [Bacteroidetes bacterium]|nr:DoxX family protein [Bacteroidota bacterium]
MNTLAILSQIIIAVSIFIVWVLRFDNIVKEFKQYKLPDMVRNLVGAAKISLATLLIAGIWYPSLVAVPALVMAFLMICAQWAHFSVRNPFSKHIPSLILLLLSLFTAGYHLGMIG